MKKPLFALLLILLAGTAQARLVNIILEVPEATEINAAWISPPIPALHTNYTALTRSCVSLCVDA